MLEILTLSSSALLAGALLMMIICRLLMLWQQDRSMRSVWFLAMYAGWFGLFLAQALNALTSVVSGLNALVFVLLVICTGYEWRDFITFQRKKNHKVDKAVTLRELANDDQIVAQLEATTDKDGEMPK
jgi:hypothetical protein